MSRDLARNGRSGFSIIELLVVVAVVGVLFGIGLPSYRTWQNRTAVREASVQIARDIDRARAEAKRTGQVVSLSIEDQESSYTVGALERSLPASVQLIGDATVTFDPPWGTQSVPIVEFQLRSTRDASIERTVRVVGVLGRVAAQ